MRDTRGGAEPLVYYELDLAGNVRRLRAPGGADLGGYEYAAFGAQVAPDAGTPAPGGLLAEQPWRWKGRWWSPRGGAAGTYDVRARTCSPELGVFLSIDEFAYHDARSTLWGWPGQNPYKYADPSGRNPLVIAVAIIAAGAIFGLEADSGPLAQNNSGTPFLGAALGALGGSLLAGSQVGAGINAATQQFWRWLVGAGGTAVSQKAGSCSNRSESVSLGMQTFSGNGGATGAMAESVAKNGDNLTFANFTVSSTKGGADLVPAARQLLQFAQEHGASTLTFEGTYANKAMADRYGAQVGDSFSRTVPATWEGLMSALRGQQ
jgi:RHS repeat-associated protein